LAIIKSLRGLDNQKGNLLQNDRQNGTNLSIQDKKASLKITAASLTEYLVKVSSLNPVKRRGKRRNGIVISLIEVLIRKAITDGMGRGNVREE